MGIRYPLLSLPPSPSLPTPPSPPNPPPSSVCASFFLPSSYLPLLFPPSLPFFLFPCSFCPFSFRVLLISLLSLPMPLSSYSSSTYPTSPLPSHSSFSSSPLPLLLSPCSPFSTYPSSPPSFPFLFLLFPSSSLPIPLRPSRHLHPPPKTTTYPLSLFALSSSTETNGDVKGWLRTKGGMFGGAGSLLERYSCVTPFICCLSLVFLFRISLSLSLYI